MKIKSLLKTLVPENLTKFATVLQVNFNEATSGEFNFKLDEIEEVLKNLNLEPVKTEHQNNIVAFEFQAENIEKFAISSEKLWVKCNVLQSIEQNLDVIKNIIQELNDVLENDIKAERIAIATSYNFDETVFKEVSSEEKMKFKTGYFVLSSAEGLEDNLNFNIIMEENVAGNVAVVDLFLQESVEFEDIAEKLEMLNEHSKNDFDFVNIVNTINA